MAFVGVGFTMLQQGLDVSSRDELLPNFRFGSHCRRDSDVDNVHPTAVLHPRIDDMADFGKGKRSGGGCPYTDAPGLACIGI